MKRQIGRNLRRDPFYCGHFLRRRRNRLHVVTVWVAIIAAAMQSLIVGHVPAGSPHPADLPRSDYLIATTQHGHSATPKHAVKHSIQAERPQSASSHGSTGETCDLCTVCSGTAPSLPPASYQSDLNCPPAVKTINVWLGEVSIDKHFLTALRPRAPPTNVLMAPLLI